MGLKSAFKRFFDLEDEYIEEEESPKETLPPNDGYPSRREKYSKTQNVVSLQSIQQTAKVVLCEPRTYEEAQDIADHLKNRRAVVINLQRMSTDQAKRIVDFLSGTVYAIGGDIQKLGINIFLCTPDNVDVSGSITEMFHERYDM